MIENPQHVTSFISPEQRNEFRASAIELTMINAPSVGAAVFSEISFGHSAAVQSSGIMESGDILFSVGVFFSEWLDRTRRHRTATRLRQSFALGHITTATTGIYLGAADIIHNNVPQGEDMIVAGAIATASALSLMRDRHRGSKIDTNAATNESSEMTAMEAFHGMNIEFLKDMKFTNIVETIAGITAVVAQRYTPDGSAIMTIVGSTGVIGIMSNSFRKQHKTLQNHG